MLKLLKPVVFWLEFTLSLYENVLDKLESLSIPNLSISEKIGKTVFKQDKVYHLFVT